MTGLLTGAEVVARLGISRQTLARWEKAGRLVREGPPRAPRYRAAEVQALSDAREAQTNPEIAILHAAAGLLRDRGVDGCTLETVAELAGLTRSGVIHHHPTKEHLLAALVRRFLDDFDDAWEREVERGDAGVGRLCRAYAAVTLQPAGDALSAAVLACALESPSVRELAGAAVRRWYDRIIREDREDGLQGDGLRMCLAADGMWLLELLHIAPLGDDDRRRVFPVDLSRHSAGRGR